MLRLFHFHLILLFRPTVPKIQNISAMYYPKFSNKTLQRNRLCDSSKFEENAISQTVHIFVRENEILKEIQSDNCLPDCKRTTFYDISIKKTIL